MVSFLHHLTLIAGGERGYSDLKFTKMHGAGNDFVVLDTDRDERDWVRLAIDMCDRHHGIGADGLLLLMPSRVADFRMRIFNADGSEANTCGNGTRCLVKYFVEASGASAGNSKITVETVPGVRDAWFEMEHGKVTSVKVRMGRPEFRDAKIPAELKWSAGKIVDIKSMIECELAVNGVKLKLDLMSVGNPHAVHFVAGQISEFPLESLGAEVQRHRIFPHGVNFEVARVISDTCIEARVWEQGVGETLACGSGACAIAVAARLHGYVGNTVEVLLPGGKLGVEWEEAGDVFLSGPAETVFVGEWPDHGIPAQRPQRCGGPTAKPGEHIKNEVIA